jgi:hypothetical protein
MPFYISPPPRNPLSAILAAVVGAVALAVSFFVGFFALLVVLGVGLVIGVVIWIRVKWLQYRMRQSGHDPFQGPRTRSQHDGQKNGYIEAEYTVVRESDED